MKMWKAIMELFAHDSGYKKFFAWIFTAFGVGSLGEWVEQVDWALGILLKLLSLLTFLVGLFISIPKIGETIKYIRNRNKR